MSGEELRAALDDIEALRPSPNRMGSPVSAYIDGKNDAAAILRVALRAAPSTEPALDVEALADWFCMNLDHPDHDPFLQPDHCDVGLADAKDAVAHIAAAYARLAESQP